MESLLSGYSLQGGGQNLKFNLRCHHPIALTDSVFRRGLGLSVPGTGKTPMSPGGTVDLHKIPKLCFEGERRGIAVWPVNRSVECAMLDGC